MTETSAEVRHTGEFVWQSGFHAAQLRWLRDGPYDAATIHRHQMTSPFARDMLAALGDGRRYVVTLTTGTVQESVPNTFTALVDDVTAIRTRAMILLADPDDAQVGEQVANGPKFDLAIAGHNEASVVEVYLPLPGRAWDTQRSGGYAIFGRDPHDRYWTRHA